MAPGQVLPTSLPSDFNPTMSSPNSKASAFVAKGRPSDTSAPSSSFTTLSIGCAGHTIPIPKLVPLGNPTWEKNACFRQLTHAIRGQLTSHSIPDLIAAVTSQLPIDTTAAFEEAMSVQQTIQHAATRIDFLEPVGFLNAQGKAMDAPPTMDAADRPAGITRLA